MRIKIFLLINLLPALAIAADLSWLEKVSSCEEFALGLTKFHAELPPLHQLSPEQGIDLDRILAVACGERFSKCKFLVCQQQVNEVTPVSVSPESQTQPAIPDGGQETTPTTPAEVVTSTTASVNPPELNASPAEVITADGGDLSWLEGELSCRDVLEEVRKRYRATDAKNPKILQKKRNELKQVLKVVCSARFEQCNFEACKTR